jgi:hemolysin activation/secretion protein
LHKTPLAKAGFFLIDRCIFFFYRSWPEVTFLWGIVVFRYITVMCIALIGVAPALAQTLPSSADPGRIRNDMNRQMAPRTPAPADNTTSPTTTAPEGSEKISFILKKLNVTGATHISNSDIAATYTPLLNKQINLTQIYDVANAITKIYHDRGYILSRAVVPQQEIENGVVSIKIIEGFINRYDIQGNPRGGKEQIAHLADRLVASGTLTAENLERYLLLMNDLPGLSVRSVLAPSKDAPGGADMTLIVEQDNISGQVSLDNNGNSFLGPERGTISAQVNSLFKSSDQWNVAFMTAPVHDELRYYNVGFRHTVGSRGTTIGFGKSHTVTSPDLPDSLGGNLGTAGESSSFTCDIAHPVIRSRRVNMNATALFDVLKNQTTYDPAFSALETRDDQRIIRLGVDMTLLDNFSGYNTLRLGVDRGLALFGASKKGENGLSRPDADPVFTKWTLDVSRLQRLFGPITLLIGLTAQNASNALLASEEFGFGGPNFGRGFDASEITGDAGYGTKLELAYTRNIPRGLVRDYQLYTFYDVGTVWNRDPGAGEDARESAASVGAGLRFTLAPQLRGDMFLAKPMTNQSPSRGELDQRDVQFKFSLTKTF